MNKSTMIKLGLGLLLALAIALGLIRRGGEDFNGNKPLSQSVSGASSLLDYYQAAKQAAAGPAAATTTVEF